VNIHQPIVIEHKGILRYQSNFTDALCSGDTGSITVTAATKKPGPYNMGSSISMSSAEFTAFVSTIPTHFRVVGFELICTGRKHNVQVDPLNGINLQDRV
jgi:hypothetical protein